MPRSKKPYIKIVDLKGEIWSDIDNYENYYQVSNMGRVKGLGRTFISRANISYTFKSRIINFSYTDRGYVTVNLCKECVCKSYRVNILVAKAFITNPYNKKEVNHLKGNKRDNRSTELEWSTHQENMQHAHRELGIKMPKGMDNVNTIRFMVKHPNGSTEESLGLNETAKRLGLSPSSVSLVLNNKQKQTKGFYFYKTA